MTTNTTPASIQAIERLGFPWRTLDPFMFCAHHNDNYPHGNGDMGPAVPLQGRDMGSDFSGKDGWSMYHGQTVPGFPQHPHCGFETISIGGAGYIDHSDSLGAAARFGAGDVQWMTAGDGVVHSEMFPLIHTDRDNPLELIQIWLNLPRKDKSAIPHFSMFWREHVPVVQQSNTKVHIIAGRYNDTAAPTPPPASWASDPESDVAIWQLEMEAGSQLILPPAQATSHRTLYIYEGHGIQIDGFPVASGHAVFVQPEATLALTGTGDILTKILVLQGKPIGEPVVQHGPFVGNTRADIEEAFTRYRHNGFGGWPWFSNDPVHPRETGRFARHADGTLDEPPGQI